MNEIDEIILGWEGAKYQRNEEEFQKKEGSKEIK